MPKETVKTNTSAEFNGTLHQLRNALYYIASRASTGRTDAAVCRAAARHIDAALADGRTVPIVKRGK